jgi:hypothetical protein
MDIKISMKRGRRYARTIVVDIVMGYIRQALITNLYMLHITIKRSIFNNASEGS